MHSGATLTASPSDIADSGATSYPATQSDAVNLFAEAMQVLGNEMMSSATTSNYATKGVTTDTTPLEWSGSVGGGTVDVTGSMTTSYTDPGQDYVPEANTDYDDLVAANSQISYQGTIDGVTLSGTTNSYTLNGEMDVEATMNMSIDVYVGTDLDQFSDTSVDMDTTEVTNDIMTWLENQTVTLKVYNDDDELIDEYTVPITEVTDVSGIVYD